MKRVSVYVLYGITVLILIATFDFYFTRHDWLSQYEKIFARKADALPNEALVARLLDQAGQDHAVITEFLESRRRSGDLSGWLLYRGGKVVESSLTPEESAASNFDLSLPRGRVARDGSGNFFVVENLSAEAQVVVGLRYDREEFLTRELNHTAGIIWKYLAGIFILCMGTFAFFFRDIMKVVELMRSGKHSPAAALRKVSSRAKSREAHVLSQGLAAFQTTTEDLEKERKLLSQQILPSFHRELKSGKTPPYDFECTLVRTDINNFTKIYNEHPVKEFVALINEFFVDVGHIVAKYRGFVHEFVGDEVIYYFKDEEVGDSAAMALAALREINSKAEEYHERATQERGHAFTIKSSLAHGSLHFGKFLEGFNIAGPPLIETVRVLSCIQERDGNKIAFEERHCERFREMARLEKYAEVQLKGYNGNVQLWSCEEHRDLGEFFVWDHEARLRKLKYYRDDRDVCRILSWMRESRGKTKDDNLMTMIEVLRETRMSRSGGEPLRQLLRLLESCLLELTDVALTDAPSLETRRFLASALRLIENFSPLGPVEPAAEQVLLDSLRVEDARVVANGIETLTHLKREKSEVVKELIFHKDNRVAANALVHLGMKGLSPLVLRGLRRLIESKNAFATASGFYALGEIALHHRLRDPVYFKTQSDLQVLIDSLARYQKHGHASVRLQAERALLKARPGSLKVVKTKKAA